MKEQLEALKLENKRLSEKANHVERGRSSHAAVFDRRLRAPFEQSRRPEGSSFPDNVPVHPLLSARTPAELRRYRVNPVDLGRPVPASEMPLTPGTYSWTRAMSSATGLVWPPPPREAVQCWGDNCDVILPPGGEVRKISPRPMNSPCINSFHLYRSRGMMSKVLCALF